jgi:cysteinyl-tRNA synthetase
MQIKLYNTLAREKQEFVPLDAENVSMYVCGPTVYDSPHIGNARSLVVFDLLYRVLSYKYGTEQVHYARNITDIDDKINNRASELGVPIKQLTSEVTKRFHSDCHYLACLEPSYEPRATENIDQIINIIQRLIDGGYAYESAGHVYFEINKFEEYTQLSGRSLEDMLSGVRIDVSEDKKHPGDFVLWKPASENGEGSSVFESPWGYGRPGWHIECSAMSKRYLGENFDIHGGGSDLIFPHHTNEIAQSRCAFENSSYARYWVHNGFLTVGGDKMSKSLGNFLTIEDLQSRGIEGEVVRYLLLATHYRKPLDFNESKLREVKSILNGLYRSLEDMDESLDGAQLTNYSEITDEDIEPLFDDLNISRYLAELSNLSTEINKTTQGAGREKLQLKLKQMGSLIGILKHKPEEWFKSGAAEAREVEELIDKRRRAKKNKDFNLADSIRDELKARGIILEDNKDGTTSWRKE